VSTAGQATYEHLPLEQEEPVPSQQEQAKRRQERFEGWLKAQAHELKTGEAAVVLAEVERLRTLMQQMGWQEAVKLIDKSLHYLHQRQEMMRYAHFQAQGYPIGSGSAGEWGERQQARRAESHETSRHALGTWARRCHVGDAQSGL